MDDNEKESVTQFLKLAKIAIIAILIVSGYLNQSALLGLV